MTDISRRDVGGEPLRRDSRSAERRQATVLFADMVGSTAISEQIGEEATFALVQAIYDLMAACVREQGGLVKDFTGDGLMALFGVPVALEDAPLRACRAGLLIQERLAAAASDFEARHGVRPLMRIGVNTGPVVIAQVRSDDAAVTALGDTVNLASRMESLAAPGTVLLSEASYRLVHGLVDASFAGEHVVKGKTEAQKTYRLNAVRQGASRFDASLSRGLTTYVGRDRELETLERGLDAVGAGLEVIDIVGDPGIGKSRLLHEFREQIVKDRAHVLIGSCTPDGQQTPFLSFIEIIRGAFRFSAEDAEEIVARNLATGLTSLGLNSAQNLALLLNLLGLKVPEGALAGLDGVLVGLRTHDLLQQLVQARCRLGPLILLFEDLHWIDSASEGVLAKLIAAEEPLRLLIVHTRRPEYQPPWVEQKRVTTLRLEPLSARETSRIVQARLGGADVPEALAKLIVAKADGNALFAEEVASFLVERGVVRQGAAGLEYDAAAVAAALPGSVQSLLTARVDRLAPNDRALLQAAAVIGRRFSPDLLAYLGDTESTIDARLAAMEALDLVHRDATSDDYIFKHALVRDALYQSLLSAPRAALHLKIAEEIEHRSGNRLTEVAEVLAYHYGQTAQADKAFTYLVQAGMKSAGVYSLDEAERYFEQALSLCEIHTELMKENTFLDLLANMSQLFIDASKFAVLTRLADKHLRHAEEFGDSPQLTALLTSYGMASTYNHEFGLGVAVMNRAWAMAERLNDQPSKTHARIGAIIAKTISGQLSQEEADRQRALSAIEMKNVTDPFMHFSATFASAWDYLLRGHTDAARVEALELAAYGRRTGDPRALGASLWILGWIDVAEERYDDAFKRGDECARVALTPTDREIGLSIKGVAQIFQGHINEGAALLRAVRERLIVSGNSYATSPIDNALGVAKVLQGDISGGIRDLEELARRREAANDNFNVIFARLTQAEVYIELLASRQRPSLLIVLKNLPFLIITAVTGRKKAMRLLTEARKNPMFTGASHFLARIDADLGILLKIGKQYDAAREHLERARSIAAQLKAEALLAKIDTALAELR